MQKQILYWPRAEPLGHGLTASSDCIARLWAGLVYEVESLYHATLPR
jgi:hypothetical protein